MSGVAMAGMMNPGRPLGLALDERADEFERLLLACSFDDVRADGREWLRRRYAEIVPLVLPAALAAVEHGRAIDAEALDGLRAAATRTASEPHGDLGVILRGGLPALRVFSSVMHSAAHEGTAVAVLAMSRAAFVAHELGTCWAEAWSADRARTAGTRPAPSPVDTPPPATEPDIALVARSPSLDPAEAEMLALAAQGLSNGEIATATSYSRQAVAWHLARLMKSWRAQNRTALVSKAFVAGVIRARTRRGPHPSEERGPQV